jgi:hypothetical protein
MTPKLNHFIGFLAILIGAFATFDSQIMPILRYLLIYFSMLTIIGVVLYSINMEIDESPTLDKIKDEL